MIQGYLGCRDPPPRIKAMGQVAYWVKLEAGCVGKNGQADSTDRNKQPREAQQAIAGHSRSDFVRAAAWLLINV